MDRIHLKTAVSVLCCYNKIPTATYFMMMVIWLMILVDEGLLQQAFGILAMGHQKVETKPLHEEGHVREEGSQRAESSEELARSWALADN